MNPRSFENASTRFFVWGASALLALLGALLLVFATPQSARAAQQYYDEYGNMFYYDLYGDGIAIYGGTFPNANLEIPEMIDGYYVKIIWQSAFKGLDQLTSVTIPSHMQEIGFDAFRNCKNLTTVTCYGGFNMQKRAFAGDPNLTTFIFYGSMRFFDSYATTTTSANPFQGSRNINFIVENHCEKLKQVALDMNAMGKSEGDPYYLTYRIMGQEIDPEFIPEVTPEPDPEETDPGQSSEDSGNPDNPSAPTDNPDGGTDEAAGNTDSGNVSNDEGKSEGTTYDEPAAGRSEQELTKIAPGEKAQDLVTLSSTQGVYYTIARRTPTGEYSSGLDGELMDAAATSANSFAYNPYERFTEILVACLALALFLAALGGRTAQFKLSTRRRIPGADRVKKQLTAAQDKAAQR